MLIYLKKIIAICKLAHTMYLSIFESSWHFGIYVQVSKNIDMNSRHYCIFQNIVMCYGGYLVSFISIYIFQPSIFYTLSHTKLKILVVKY